MTLRGTIHLTDGNQRIETVTEHRRERNGTHLVPHVAQSASQLINLLPDSLGGAGH